MGVAFLHERDSLLARLHPASRHESIDRIRYEPGKLLDFQYYDSALQEGEGPHMEFPTVSVEELELFVARAEYFSFAESDYEAVKKVAADMVGVARGAEA